MAFEKITNININYLSDESRLTGDADWITFCESTYDIKEAVSEACRKGLLITVQGARTGITGGAVPVKSEEASESAYSRIPVKTENTADSRISANTENTGNSRISAYTAKTIKNGKTAETAEEAPDTGNTAWNYENPHSGASGNSLKKLSGLAVINLSKVKQVYSIRPDKAGYRIKAGAGLTLTEIEGILKGGAFDTSLLDKESLQNLEILKKKKYFFPPDPTEKSASIGGVSANCASGSRTFHYGSARNFIRSLDVVLADSSELKLERDSLRNTALGNSFSLRTEEGKVFMGFVPQLEHPDCKNAAGLFTENDMDLTDLFIGSEGILGIISAVEFLVIQEPEFINSILIFPPDRELNLKLVECFRDAGHNKYNYSSFEAFSDKNNFKKDNSCTDKNIISGLISVPESGEGRNSCDDGTLSCNKISGLLNVSESFKDRNITNGSLTAPCSERSDLINAAEGLRIVAVEYFDMNALSLLSRYIKEGLFKSLFPFSEENSGGALYVEIHSDNSEGLEKLLENISGMLDKEGVDSSCVFISDGESDLQRMKDFRHSIPESVNMTIDRIRKKGNDITKLGTDFAVPDSAFRELFYQYYSNLDSSELNYAVFGHAGNNHLHVNIIPRSRNDYLKGKELVKVWAEKAVSLGGTVSAEHGTGRLKKEYLEIMYGREGIKKLQAVKTVFDPGFIINRGVMI